MDARTSESASDATGPHTPTRSASEIIVRVNEDQTVQESASPASQQDRRRSSRPKRPTPKASSAPDIASKVLESMVHQRPTPSTADTVSHAIIEEGRDSAVAEGGQSTDGLVQASTGSRQPPQQVHDRNRNLVAVPNSRVNDAGGTSVHNFSLDHQPGAPSAMAVDNALVQLQNSDVWLTDDTMKLVQDVIRNTLAREGVLRPGTHTVDPVCIGENGFSAPPVVPHPQMHLILPLRHTTPYLHWTLALIFPESCRFEWYDPLPLQARTDRIQEWLRSWPNPLSRDKTFDFIVVPGLIREDGQKSCQNSGVAVLIAIWELMQSRQPPTDVDVGKARFFLANLLKAETCPVSHSDTSPEMIWREVEAREPPRPTKRQRPNGTTPAAEPSQTLRVEMAVSDQLASLKSCIETWTAWYQSLRVQHGQSTLIPNLSFARRRLKDMPGKLSRQKDRVEVARREHGATWTDLEIARSQSQDPSGIELREAEEAFAAACGELEKQRSSEMEMQNLLNAAALAVEVEPLKEELQGSLRKLQGLVSQPWLPETDIGS